MSAPEPEAARRLDAARAGMSEELGPLLEGYRAYLTLVAERELDSVLRPKGGASDVVQETLMDAVKAFGQFRGESEAELRGWLHQMLLNNVASFGRRYRGAEKRQIGREVALGGTDTSGAGAGLVADVPTPSRQAMAHEQSAAIQLALARLPDDYRRIIQMRYEGERSFDDIGRELGLTPNAARKLWVRAIKRLRQESE